MHLGYYELVYCVNFHRLLDSSTTFLLLNDKIVIDF